MDRRLLFLVCLALIGLVQGYTLRDMLRERALRRLKEFDTNQYTREYDDLRDRALSRLREFHLRRMFDEEKEECKDVHDDCKHVIPLNGGQAYCNDPDEHIQWFVKTYCRKTCHVKPFCKGESSGEIKPPFPGIPECEDLYPDCAPYVNQGFCTEKDKDYAHLVFYLNKYCYASCNPDKCSM